MAKKKRTPPISIQVIPYCWRMIKQSPAIILWSLINAMTTLLLIFYVSHPIIKHFTTGATLNKHTIIQILILIALFMGKGLLHSWFNYASLCQINASNRSKQQTNQQQSTYSPLKKAWRRILFIDTLIILFGPFFMLGNRIYYGYCILFSKPIPMNPAVVNTLLPCSILLENRSVIASYQTTRERLRETWNSNNLTGNTSSGIIDFMYLMISIAPAAIGLLFAQNNPFMLHLSIGCSVACFLVTSIFHHLCHQVAIMELYHHSKNTHQSSDHALDLKQAFIPIITQSPFKQPKTP